MVAQLRRVLGSNSPGVRRKVLIIYGALVAVNLGLWAATITLSLRYPLVLAFGLTAYGFGLKHAVDADHISAIDNVTRKLMQEKKQPVAVGFFFSLGHSTVVFIMATLAGAGSAYIATSLASGNSQLKVIGSLVGTAVSAIFLLAMALLNLAVLIQVVRNFRAATSAGVVDEAEVEGLMNQRGFFARIFRGLFRSIDTSWKMYPVGFLFGLGFDTATEIGLLTTTSYFVTQHIPFVVVLLLPLLFTAGMCLADTTDGVLMLGAYGWAFVKPIRKLYYNMTVTLISVLVALVVGGIEALSIISGELHLTGGFWNVVGALSGGENFGKVGVGIIAILVICWLASTVIYRLKRYDEIEVRRGGPPPRPATT